MKKPLEFYVQQKAQFESNLKSIRKKLAFSSTLRLVVFLSAASCIYIFFGNIKVIGLVGVVWLATFLMLLFRHGKLQYQQNFNRKLLKINQLEIDVLNGNRDLLDPGNEFIDPSHFYSYDIDLFGVGSFFQYCNRTATNEGKKKLATYITENEISEITKKQKGLKELSEKAVWRQKFTALAQLVKVDYSTDDLVKWLLNYRSVFPKFINGLSIVFSLISLGLIVLVSFQLVAQQILLIWFILGLVISGLFLKKVTFLYQYATKAKETFKQYYKLLHEIETTTFTSKILIEKQAEIKTEILSASKIVAKFSKVLDALDQRNNLLVGILGNGLLLWDLQQVYKLEKWIENYGKKVEKWFDIIAFFDAENSMANFIFNHPKYVFPEIVEDSKLIEATQLGHFLLDKKNRIDNNFEIKKQQFFIVTGANMAGKSTFLRTVSTSIVMANMGLTVCAEKFKYTPIKLITSMRTSDSLVKDESYFFSELKRLKFIVDAIVNDSYFVILDEILKGTNSTDKAIGSKKFVEKLVASNSTGIIATHDLSLCEIEKNLTEVKNYYFDAEIINNQLSFDYLLKSGVCKNMNASFLLKKMEII